MRRQDTKGARPVGVVLSLESDGAGCMAGSLPGREPRKVERALLKRSVSVGRSGGLPEPKRSRHDHFSQTQFWSASTRASWGLNHEGESAAIALRSVELRLLQRVLCAARIWDDQAEARSLRTVAADFREQTNDRGS